jgi:hypothetical protein
MRGQPDVRTGLKDQLMMTYLLTSRVALVAAMLILCSGCELGDKSPVSQHSSSGFAAIPVTGSSLNGAITYHGGILVASHGTGTISVCWKTCKVIGKTEPSGTQDLVLSGAGNFSVYVANVATGHVMTCGIETDEWAREFKGGHCEEIGIAAR